MAGLSKREKRGGTQRERECNEGKKHRKASTIPPLFTADLFTWTLKQLVAFRLKAQAVALLVKNPTCYPLKNSEIPQQVSAPAHYEE